MSAKRVILAGGSGFIGRALAQSLCHRGYEVVILTRTPSKRDERIREVQWDGENPGPWVKSLDGAEALVNLAGKSINCPHTPENVKVLIDSRVNSVRALAAALRQVAEPPRVWVQAGAVGYYGDQGADSLDENSPPGANTLAEICRQWEAAFEAVPAPPRKALLRIGIVLGRDGGALPVLSRLAKLFLGGAAGGGRQYMSWIHLADLVQIFLAAVEQDLSGVYNAVGPAPVANAEFMRALRRACHRPWSPPAPEFAVRIGCRLMNSDPALALGGNRCLPRNLLARGFKFEFNNLDRALHDLCR